MGAGSSRVSEADRRRYYDDTHPHDKHHIECRFHSPQRQHDIGICHFLNTGKPYTIEKCPECKREYVREL